MITVGTKIPSHINVYIIQTENQKGNTNIKNIRPMEYIYMQRDREKEREHCKSTDYTFLNVHGTFLWLTTYQGTKSISVNSW